MNESNYKKALTEALRSDYATEEKSEEHIFSAGFDKKMDKLIKRRNKPYFNLINTASKRAACVIVLIVLLALNPLTVKAVINKIFGYYRADYSDHIELVPDITESDRVPKNIERKYYISALSDGYEIVKEYDYNVVHRVLFQNENEEYVLFTQHIISGYKTNIDNEHTEFKEVTYGDITYFVTVFYDNGMESYMYMWNNGEYIFKLKSNLDEEKVLELCRSVKPEGY